MYEDALRLILDMCYGYDGATAVEDFQELVDDIAEIARRGLDSDEVLLTAEELDRYFK